MKKNYIKILSLLTIVFCIITCKEDSSNDFVKVSNGKFYLNDHPYYYLGTNFWHGAYLGANLVKGDQDRLKQELDQLVNYGITNLRIMASSEASDLEMSVKPAFQTAPGVYNKVLLEGLDFLLEEMSKRKMKAVLVLNNYWQWSGGMSQYVNWLTGEPIIDPDKTGDWDGFQFQSAKFYTNKKANELFHNYINMLVNRHNTVNGLQYKDDPTIMAWQLANEPRPAPDVRNNRESYKAFSNWICKTAAYIHSIDSNHLVSSGNEGEGGCRGSLDIYSNSHKCSYIDYLTFHIWPKNWGWYNAKLPDETFDKTLDNTLNYFKTHVEIAGEQNKPIILEEFGLERDSGTCSHSAPTTYRDRYLDYLFKLVVDSAKAKSAIAGLNFWAWGGLAKANSSDYIWRKGDSFMGDPPQEPQGLNSVFSTDTTTLQIFKKYNKELEVLMSDK